jgi:hypothetical protein
VSVVDLKMAARRGTVRLPEEQVAQLVDLYKAGAIINDLARHFKSPRRSLYTGFVRACGTAGERRYSAHRVTSRLGLLSVLWFSIQFHED